MNKKRLLILIWDMGIGGVQKRIRDISLEMDKKHNNWEIFLLIQFERPGFYLNEIKGKTGLNILTSPFYLRSGPPKRLSFFPWIVRESRLVLWTVKMTYAINPDVFLTFLDQLSVIAVINKIIFFWRKTKYILNEGNLTSVYLKLHRRKPEFWNFLVRLSYPLADKIICPTKAVMLDLCNNYQVTPEKIKVIHNWTLFNTDIIRKKIYDLIFIGRLEIEKNPLFLIDLIIALKERFPAIKLAVLGTGSLENEMKLKIKKNKLGKNIRLMGYRKKVKDFLLRSKILVLPTLNEGLPNVALEAGACRVPTITLTFPGDRELIRNNITGYIARSDKDFINCCNKLLTDNKRRSQMSEKAYEHITKNFSAATQKRFINELLD